MMDPNLSKELKAVTSLLEQGNLELAASTVTTLKGEHNEVGDVWALDGEIAIRQGRISDALVAVDRAVELEHHLPDRHIQRARCQVLAGLTEEARDSARQALKSDISRVDHLLILGGVLVRCDDHLAALTLYQKADEIAPRNVDVQRGLASVYRFLGKLHEAEQATDLALQLDPHDYEMIGLRSSVRTQTKEDNHIQSLTRLEKRGVKGWRGAVHVAYALAKEFEDIGEFDRSFQALQRGAVIKRRYTKYDLNDDLKIFDAVRSAFSRKAIEDLEGTGHVTNEPIFVLGMPRTGSTLVERIVSSHSQVQNAGELSSFSVEMMRLVKNVTASQKTDRLTLPSLTLQIPMQSLGHSYMKSVESIRDGSPRFVDKLPLDSLNIGLIHVALPKAKIIHVIRNPMDACLAMYKYLFKNGYPFSYDLNELAAYYIEYHKLMGHWRTVLPAGRIYDIHYEDIIADLRGEAMSLIQFLELDWEDKCEDFHTNKQASTTGSASQVRQPVYSSSVGKWRNFKSQLQPLKMALEAAGISIDETR